MGMERFLVVDNDQGNALFFEMLFKDLGFDIHLATTGDEAINIVKEKHIQMIIVAWELAGMPGTIFIQKARQSRNRKYLPCLIYSKRMSEEDVKLTHDLGFPDILPMPFNKEAARTMVEQMIERENNLDPIEANIRKIDTYIANGQPQEGLKLLGPKMYVEGPFLCRVETMAALVWLAMGKLDKAKESVDKALAIEPDNNKTLQAKAKILSRLGSHDEAIEILSKLHESSPANLNTRIGLGSAYVKADRHDEAKKVFEGIMEIDPDCQEAKDEVAVMAFKEGNMSLAEQLIAETEAGDEMASVFNNMAIGQINKDEFDQGIGTYLKALALLSDKARTHLLNYNLGLAYKKKGDIEDAFKYFCKSYLIAPDYEKAYNSLAHAAKVLKEKKIKPDKELVAQVKEARTAFKSSLDKAS